MSTETTAPEPAATPAAPAPAPTPAPPAPQAPPAPGPQAPTQAESTFSKEYVTELRGEAKANREARQAAEAAAQAAAAERDALKSELATLRTEAALAAAIKAANGNDVAALALKGAGALEGVDLSDPAAVEAKVKEFIDAHPELKATPSATRSTIPSTGGTGEGDVTKAQFDAMKPTEKNALFIANPTLYNQLTGR